MATGKTKSFKIDFYVVTVEHEKTNTVLSDLLGESVAAGHSESLPVNDSDDEHFQIRQIQSWGNGKIYRGVFGRCRYSESLRQGNKDGDEHDVEIKPGHGLVEKNYFLFFPEHNLLVYQRNISGSHYTKFQTYIERATKSYNITLEPILTSDSYQRLLSSEADVKRIELSFSRPKDPSLYPHQWTKDAIKLISSADAVTAKISISVGRAGGSMKKDLRNAAVTLAKDGLVRVARVKISGETEPIDLIASRIIETATVKISDKGRPTDEDIYAALNSARDARKKDLRAFFGK